MLFRSKLITAGVFAAVAAVAMAAGGWYFYLRSDAPPAVSLATAIQSLATTTPEADSVTSGSTATDAPTSEPTTDSAAPVSTTSDDGSLAGTWTVVQGENSFTGYRVDETLAGVGATTAVGRTNDVTGTLEFDGTTITAVEITADLTTLTSDKELRDGQLRTQAIETGAYPTATFVLTSPIVISEVPADGATITQTVTGELTLHGVTRTIEIEVEGALQNGLLVVVGSTEIVFADYEIEQPVSMSVVSIEDHGTMEFQLIFEQA
jgi:polyisoprenoid-binding protein YceI